MEFHDWLLSKGFDPTALTASQREALSAAWRAETNSYPLAQPATPILTTQTVASTPAPAAPTPQPQAQPAKKQSSDIDAVVEAQREENVRKERITDLVRQSINERPEYLDAIEAVGRLAIEGKWDTQRTELELLRCVRGTPNFAFTVNSRHEITQDVVEAAVCRAAGLTNLEKHFSERALDASHKQWRHGLGLGELVLTYARKNGFHGYNISGNLHSALKAAFTVPDLRASGSTSPSLHTLSGVLSNVANKFLRVAFESVDMAWRMVTAIRSVNDFKTITSYSLTGDLTYEQVGPGGDLEHGSLGAESYTNKADTYGRMIGISRTDLINDDLGALSGAARRLGRGGAIKLNKVFWGVFLNNSSFFTAGRNNAFTGAGTALSLTSLGTADSNFRLQTDPDGNPLGLMPRKLVVPTALRISATNLVNSELAAPDSTGTANTTVGAMFATRNPFQGAYDVVSSPYMSDSSLTGYSTTAWYLLADPQDLPVIETCFLNGMESPTVETADADFGTLGIALRGYHDFGCALQEYRAGVRMAGA